MRVWILTSELPHEFAGGIARYVDNFARTMGAAGHEAVVIYRTDKAADQLVAPGFRAIGVVPRYERLTEAPRSSQPDEHPAYPYNIMAYWPAFSYQLAEEVLRLIDELGPPDVIESQEFAALPYYLLQRKLSERTPLSEIPIIAHMHSAMFDLMRINQEPRYRNPDYWLGQMEKFCLTAADAVLSPSEFLKGCVAQTFNGAFPIERIPYPFIADYECPPAEGTPGELVYVGRLEWRKGVTGLTDACARLWQQGRDFRLNMIGGDVMFAPKGCTIGDMIRARHQKWIDSGNLNLLGQVKFTDVRAHVRNAWAALIPSHWENFPNTAIETMAAGQVAVVSRQGGQAEMVAEDGINGFIFDWEKPGDLDRQLERVLDLDASQRLDIARRAPQRIKSLCDPALVLPRRLEHFQRVIDNHKPRSVFPTTFPTSRETPQPVPAALVADEPETPGLLSVVIPFYNLAEYIDETLDSVRASTYSPMEVIIIDDGSTEEASVRKIAEIEARNLPGVRIVRTDNQGLAAARNNAVRLARGEFIALVDADDLIERDFFARGVDVLNRYGNVGFVFAWVRYFDNTTGIWPAWNAEFPYLLGHNMTCVLSVVRRSGFLAAGGNNPAFAYALEDYAGWVGMLEAGYVGVSLAEPLVHYRIRPGSMRRSMNDDQAVYLHDLLTQTYPDAYRRWGAELFNLQNANGPGRLWNHPAMDSADATGSETQRRVIDELRAWTRDVEQAKGWVEQQWEASRAKVTAQESTIAELRAWAAELEKSKAWLEQQSANWESTADRAQGVLREHKAWTAELEESKAWLEQQREHFMARVGEQENVISELRAWIGELQQAKDWHDGQRRHLETVTQELHAALENQRAERSGVTGAYLSRLRNQWWWRMGRGVARATGVRGRAPTIGSSETSDADNGAAKKD